MIWGKTPGMGYSAISRSWEIFLSLSLDVGKKYAVYFSMLVYRIREICLDVGKCWVGYKGW
jgi:hypothetical protein